MVKGEKEMKKIFLFAAVALSFAACTKENEVINESVIDASTVVFNIDVRNADATETKGVKTAWENGDVVYVFFEDNPSQYVKMTYNGSSWAYTDNADGTTFSGLHLLPNGMKLSAVYMPEFVCSEAPTFDSINQVWSFGDVNGYFQAAESVDFTVTSTSNVATLNATICLAAPANIVQVYVNETAPASGNEYVLNMTNVKPFTFEGIVPGGAATVTEGTVNFPLTAYLGTIGGDTGYFFWGILADASAGAIDYNFQMVQQNAEKKYAVSSSSKTVTGKNLTGSTAINLTYTGGLTDNGPFVNMGYAGCPLWATGNLSKTEGKIVDPVLAGEYFMYGKTTVYNKNDSAYTGQEEPLSTDADVAYSVNTAWRIPTAAQLDALVNSSNTTTEWKADWYDTILFGPGGGRLITSKANGISLFFAAAGYYDNGTSYEMGTYGRCWSSTKCSVHGTKAMCWDFNSVYVFGSTSYNRELGVSVRPVKN